MFDWILSNGATNFALDSAGSATILSIVAFLAIFAAALAERAYRMQSLGVLAGLATAMLLATIFVLVTIGHALIGLIWLQEVVSGELFFYIFCLGFSGIWLGAALSSSRLNALPQARRVFLRWQMVLLSILAVVFACGAGEGYGIFRIVLNAALRQIFIGVVAGIFIIAAGIAVYRLWRERVALWFWLALASLVFAGALSLFHFLPPAPLLAYAALGLAALLIIVGLFADHVRFLRLESELRAGFMENALKLEEENRRHAAILKLNREAVVHFDRDERIVFVNSNFLQLVSAAISPASSEKKQSGKAAPITSSAETNETNSPASQLTAKKLSALLPRELYQKLTPSMQEARLGRTSLMEIRHLDGGAEKLFQVFAAPLRDNNDKIYSTHLSLLDITARHWSARSLENAAAEKAKELRIFQQSIENANDAVVVTGTDSKILYANEAFERITGFARSEILGRTPQAYHHDSEVGRLAEINRRLIQHKSWRGEMSGRRKDGSRFAGDLSVSLVADEDEKIIRYLWVERDVTSYKDLEARSQQLEKELAQKTAELARVQKSQASLQEHTGELQQRVDQLAKLMEIGEDIRLNAGLDMIMTRISEAVAALGWQRVLIFQRYGQEIFSLVANSGFANRAASLRQVRQVPYTELAPYLLERFQLSQSFFIDSRQLTETKRLAFLPAHPEIVPSGDWQSNDALLVPIRSREQIVGLIVAASPADGRRPDLQRVRDLELLADDAAIAIENTRLLALHQRNERQARVLADLGQVFRVAGALEQVMSDIAGIGAGAFACPCLVVLLPARERGWLGAFGTTTARSGRAQGRLLEEIELAPTWLAQVADAVATMDIANIELKDAASLPPFIKEAVKVKSPGAAAAAAKKIGTAQVVALRSRGRNLGFMAYLMPEDNPTPAFTQAHDLAFAAEIADRAALAIENARLFHEIDEKAMDLERANQFIAEFLASVSHELRTPMHSILQFSEILLSEIPGALNAEQKRQLAVVQRSGKNLLVLLNDILDLSKIEAGKMEAIIEEFEPAQVIRDGADSIRPLCEKKSLALRVRLDENLPEQFRSDRSILSRVLTNLLGNAVKFTEKGEIEVWARKRDRLLVFSVRDTGIGIPASRQKEIFEPFRQLENSETRRHGGTGLGLAISKKMLDIIHGKIELVSETGKGSKFTVHIPESTLPARAVGREQKGKKEKGKEVLAKKEKSGLRFSLVNRAKSPRILVVEDDESTRYAMQFILENAGYKVDFAEGGEKALLAAQHQRPDLILMDIMMPNMDGYQVARMLKAQKQLAHIPVIALTARAMKGDREKALDAGCNDYLTKPFESKDILGMLEKWLGNGT
jgi:PAS domain S-box-containing protein